MSIQTVHSYFKNNNIQSSCSTICGRKFRGPVELTNHHISNLDGFLTLARIPVKRPLGLSPIVFQGVRAADLEEKIRLKALEMGLKDPRVYDALASPLRTHLRYLVLKNLHFLQPWYHDCIRRRESERRLEAAGSLDGSFLVRYRNEDGCYVLSLIFGKEPRHYKIEQNLNRLSIEGGQHFETLIEMIDHYHFRQDGLLCKLRSIVQAPDFSSKSVRNSLSSESLNSSTKSQVDGKKFDVTLLHEENVLNVTNPPVAVKFIPNEAEGGNNKDLISFNDWPNVSALLAKQSNLISKSASSPNCVQDLLESESFQKPLLLAIQTDAILKNQTRSRFASSMSESPFLAPVNQSLSEESHTATCNLNNCNSAMVDKCRSQSMHPDGQNLLGNNVKFRSNNACPIPSNSKPISLSVTNNLQSEICNTCTNVILTNSGLAFEQQTIPHLVNSILPTESLNYPPIIDVPWDDLDCSEDHSQVNNSNYICTVTPTISSKPVANIVGINPFAVDVSPPAFLPTTHTSPHQSPGLSSLNKPSDSENPSRVLLSPVSSTEEAQRIYDSLPSSTFFLHPDNLSLLGRLGGGNFGYVIRGIYRTPHGQEVPVAVKTLKESQISAAGEESILCEAKTMTKLKHRHIVRLIGVCKASQFMLVLELAPLGPINKYLRRNKDTPIEILIELMYQVALGMAYLESFKFVHRDLAARNVLLVSRRFAKISDFGMSKALNFGSDYYRAETAGKWPLKWYAPECIYYFRFDSKSDVWSYGIALWEVFSFGERPYKDMKGAQILAMIDQGLRLSKPPQCPLSVYNIMLQCWNFEGVHRPNFAEVVLEMSELTKTSSFSLGFDVERLRPQSKHVSHLSTTGSSGGSAANSGTSEMAFF